MRVPIQTIITALLAIKDLVLYFLKKAEKDCNSDDERPKS